MLVELGRPSKEIPELLIAISAILKESAALMMLSHKEVLTIIVVDEATTVEEVANAIATLVEVDYLSYEHIQRRKSYSGTQVANVTLPVIAANKLLQREKSELAGLTVGFT